MRAPSSAPLTELTGPRPDSDRLHALDILRGLALAGMILVHFHQRMRNPAAGDGWLEGSIGWIVWVGFETKAWAVFAFLFGAGFALFLRRLEARGAPAVRLYLRRLLALALFGVAATILFGVDILLEYAIWGLPLLAVRRWSTRALLVTATLAAALRPSYYAVRALVRWFAGVTATTGDPVGVALWQARRAATEGADYVALLAARAQYLGWEYREPTSYLPDTSFTLFIVGLLALRQGVLDEPRKHTRLIVGWMVGGFLAWATGWLILSKIPELPVRGLTWTLRYGLGIVQEQWLAFAYIGAVVLLLAYRPVWMHRLRGVGFAGRMALTNYLLQAAIVDYLASGYGLGLTLRPYVYLLGSVLLFALLMVASTAWLSRHPHGPAERWWRLMTYGGRATTATN